MCMGQGSSERPELVSMLWQNSASLPALQTEQLCLDSFTILLKVFYSCFLFPSTCSLSKKEKEKKINLRPLPKITRTSTANKTCFLEKDKPTDKKANDMAISI